MLGPVVGTIAVLSLATYGALKIYKEHRPAIRSYFEQLRESQIQYSQELENRYISYLQNLNNE